jgi:putative tricarboxylic transport membrane protein
MREPGSAPHQIDKAGLIMAAILVFLAGLLWREAYTMGGTVSYGVGPTAALKVVAGGLLFLALATGWSAFRSGGDAPEPLNAKPVWLILAASAVMIAFIRFGIGFIPAMTILFATTARAFGRRPRLDLDIGIGIVIDGKESRFRISHIYQDIVIGFITATLIYLLFSKLLTLTLPQGPLERLLG